MLFDVVLFSDREQHSQPLQDAKLVVGAVLCDEGHVDKPEHNRAQNSPKSILDYRDPLKHSVHPCVLQPERRLFLRAQIAVLCEILQRFCTQKNVALVDEIQKCPRTHLLDHVADNHVVFLDSTRDGIGVKISAFGDLVHKVHQPGRQVVKIGQVGGLAQSIDKLSHHSSRAVDTQEFKGVASVFLHRRSEHFANHPLVEFCSSRH